MKKQWKVGELAKLTGLTVRTLRYYDQIGLFSPSDHSNSGHRLYNKSDILKLQNIQSLKQIGLSLEDVQSVVDDSNSESTSHILAIQMARLKEDIRIQQKLLKELENVLALSRNKQPLQVENLTKLLGAMKMNQEKYFTKEQLDQMKSNYEKADAETLRRSEKEFTLILEKLRGHMRNRTSATDKEVQELARKWSEIANSFTAHDPELQKAAEKFHAENPGNDLQNGMDAEIYHYIMSALKGN
ncbi:MULTISPECIES: MerR family transcriptional regulator [Domibacillus]|uniref:DNA-binding transcriptional regulator, MerR family n=1 Tax=Domibacillus enclensis TaxID=1017273 RepID=A0A1N7C1B3_9BACI|nr:MULTISPECIES: MerR family transcriptional regulator [Domibacillus]OXS74194.1 hypothetical protein B1B05_17115 [Domibacillus enclensis]SIR57352.1 DNA-binding transcriptional regulator, MerR family [Domibacillus enclensis]